MADKQLTYTGMEESDGYLSVPAAGGKEFAPCPEGLHSAEIVSAKFRLKEKTWEGETKVVPEVMLAFKTDQEYEDDETGEKRPFLVFSNMTLSAGENANLTKFFKDVCGIPVPVADGRIRVQVVNEHDDKKDIDVKKLPQFVGLECKVLVKHNKSKDGTRVFANVENYIVEKAAQKKANAERFADSIGEDDEEKPAKK